MKHISLSFLFAISISFLFAQTPETRVRLLSSSLNETVIQVEILDWKEQQIALSEGRALIPIIQDGTPLLIKGAPDVPKIAKLLHIPETGNMAFEIIASNYRDVRDVLVAPSKGNLTRNINPDLVNYEFGKWYTKDAFYPGDLAQLQQPFVQRSVRGQAVWLQPVQYNPVQKILRIYSSLTVRIFSDGSPGINELPKYAPKYPGLAFESLFRKSFINYHASNSLKGRGEPERMLIIAPDDYADALSPLVDWKQQSGIHTTLVPISEIGSGDATIVRDYIKQVYSNNAITYVLIVGDASQISPEMRPSGGTLYSCDNCFGYMNDEDHFSDVFVGRLHAANLSELNLMINRILEYEKTPLVDETSNWCATGMASASAEGAGFGDDGQADYEHGNEWKSKHLEAGFEEYWEFYDGDQSAISPTPGSPTADQPGDPANTGIIDLMNQRGVSIYNYTGHGWEQGLVSGNFTTDAVSALRNHGRYPILIGVACCAGNFTNDNGGDCLGEAWQRAGDLGSGEPWGGIAGFFSSDFQSWSPPMEGQDGMNQYLVDAEGVAYIPTIGGMAAYGNTLMIGAYAGDGELMADFWNPFADPTTLPRTRLPQQITATHVTTKYIGDFGLLVSCPVEGARVGLQWQGQTLASELVINGTATLFFEPLDNVGEIIVTVTQFNYIPYQGVITVVPLSGPFVIQKNVSIDDQMGNNNQQADYNESVLINLDINNVGLSEATSTSLALTTTNPYITLTDSIEELGVIDPVTLLTLQGVFGFIVADDAPDGEKVEFTLLITYNDTLSTESSFILTLLAPSLQVPSYNITDLLPGGNGNKRIESGETVTMSVLTKNIGGSASPAIVGKLVADSPWVTVDGPVNLIGLTPDGETFADFMIQVSPDAPIYEQVNFSYQASAGAYSTQKVIGPFWINPIVADFEESSSVQVPWDTTLVYPWVLSQESPFLGISCMESGNIEDEQSSTLSLMLNVLEDGEIGFARRTSTELDWDYLRFYIDGNLQDEWSGENPWATFSYPVSTGMHTFSWTYDKDEYYSDGDDKTWIDDVYLPIAEEVISTTEATEGRLQFNVAPNPTKNLIWVEWHSDTSGPLSLEILSTTGQTLFTYHELWSTAGKGQKALDLSNYPSGVYFLQGVIGNTHFEHKLVKSH